MTNHIKRTFSVTKCTAKKKKNYRQRQEKDRIITQYDRKQKLHTTERYGIQDAQLSQRDRTAGCVIVFAKSRRLELGDNILRTVQVYLQPL